MQTKYAAKRWEEYEHLPMEVVITVRFNEYDGKYTPRSDELGCGKDYNTSRGAADDMARRHGYHITGELE